MRNAFLWITLAIGGAMAQDTRSSSSISEPMTSLTTTAVATSSQVTPSPTSSLANSTASSTPYAVYISYGNGSSMDTLFKNSWNSTILTKYNIYTPDMMTDVALRTAAITLTLCSGFVFIMGFAKRNLIAYLIGTTLFGHAFAVWAGMIPFLRIVTPPNIYWTNWTSVTLLCFTSETFLWALYLRFTAVVPMQSPWLRNFCKIWLTLESAMIFSNTMLWNYYAYTANQAGKGNCANAYSYMNFVQATTALFLSGYFVIVFYLPKLRGLSTWLLMVKLYSTGLIYLFGEVTLHLMYYIAYRSTTTQPFYTGFSGFATAVRLALFVVFLFKMKDTIAAADRDRESQRNAKVYGAASRVGNQVFSAHPTGSGHSSTGSMIEMNSQGQSYKYPVNAIRSNNGSAGVQPSGSYHGGASGFGQAPMYQGQY